MHRDQIPDMGCVALAFNLRCLMDRSPSLSSRAAIAIRMEVDVKAIDAIFAFVETAPELIHGIASVFGVTADELTRPVPPYSDECDLASVQIRITSQVPADHMAALQQASARPPTYPVERAIGYQHPRSQQ